MSSMQGYRFRVVFFSSECLPYMLNVIYFSSVSVQASIAQDMLTNLYVDKNLRFKKGE